MSIIIILMVVKLCGRFRWEMNDEELEKFVEEKLQEQYSVFKQAIINTCDGFSGGAVFGFKVEPPECESAIIKIHVENVKGAFHDWKSDDDIGECDEDRYDWYGD